MTCPAPFDLARLASGESADGDDVLLLHVEGCPHCTAELRETAALRELAAALPGAALAAPRRRALGDAVMALADLEAADDVPAAAPSRRPIVGVMAFAAAAAVAAVWLARPAPRRLAAVVQPAPSPEPQPAPPPQPEQPPQPPQPEPQPQQPTVTAVASADYDEVAAPAEHRVVLRAGRLTIDGARAPERAIVVVADNAALRATGARFEAGGARGALRSVRVFAGSVEITQGPRVVVISAGETWTLDPPATPPAPATAPAGPTRSHFAAGWAHLRAERFADAARELTLAADEPGVAEDAAYWAAVAWARGGEPVRARDAFTAFLAAHAGSPRAGEAHLALARLHLDEGARDRALPHLDAAAADPDPRVRAAAERLR